MEQALKVVVRILETEGVIHPEHLPLPKEKAERVLRALNEQGMLAINPMTGGYVKTFGSKPGRMYRVVRQALQE